MRIRLLLPALLALMPVLVLSGAPASAQTTTCLPDAESYPPGACALALGSSERRPGEPTTVTGGGFAPNSAVTIRFDGNQVGTAQTDASGAFTTTITIPSNAAPGTHTITSTGTDPSGRPRALTATVNVVGPQAERGGGLLPRTGSASAVPTGIAGVALVGVGSLAVVAARRRRTA